MADHFVQLGKRGQFTLEEIQAMSDIIDREVSYSGTFDGAFEQGIIRPTRLLQELRSEQKSLFDESEDDDVSKK